MAALQHRNGSYRILFRFSGKQHSFTIGSVTKEEANTKVKQVEYLLMQLKQPLLSLPDGVDIVARRNQPANRSPATKPTIISNGPLLVPTVTSCGDGMYCDTRSSPPAPAGGGDQRILDEWAGTTPSNSGCGIGTFIVLDSGLECQLRISRRIGAAARMTFRHAGGIFSIS